jgi:hypothetical protein
MPHKFPFDNPCRAFTPLFSLIPIPVELKPQNDLPNSSDMRITPNFVISRNQLHIAPTGNCDDDPIGRVFMKLPRQLDLRKNQSWVHQNQRECRSACCGEDAVASDRGSHRPVERLTHGPSLQARFCWA